MTGDAVKAIKDLAEENYIVVEDNTGVKFCRDKLRPVVYQPEVQALSIHSLDGIIDYLNIHNVGPYIIHIVDHNLVRILGPIEKPLLKRNCYLLSTLRNYEGFPYERYIPHEEFIIKLRTKFEETEDLLKLIEYTSKLTIDNHIEATDDGCSQTAMVKKGISGSLGERKEAPSMLVLQPFRTFREIEQPESLFLFRVKASGAPTCALFEADGQCWKDEAVESIANYLQDGMKNLDIDVPIIK